MKFISWILGIIIVLLAIGMVIQRKDGANEQVNSGNVANTSPTASSTQTSTIPAALPTIIPITHATAIIQWGDIAVYTDPTGPVSAFTEKATADIIVVTDIHGDHLSTSTLSALINATSSSPSSSSSTQFPVLIVPKAVKDLLPTTLAARAFVLANGSSTSVSIKEGTKTHTVTITAIPMYNLPESKDSRHTKGRGNGYVIEKDGSRVYIAGDTSGTPEMRALKNIDIALVPMNLPYTMSVEEAAEAVLAFGPKHVYPYHYRGQNGLSDVAKFKSLVNAGNPAINVVLLNWYVN